MAAQDYSRRIAERGEVPLEVWDRERLIELTRDALGASLVGRTDAALLGAMAAVETGAMTEPELERLSHRWLRENPAWHCVLEASIVAILLSRNGRTDLACYGGLALVRAACYRTHESLPPDEAWSEMADFGRLLFVSHALILWDKRSEFLNASELINAHVEAGALVTHAVRCVRLAEVIALLAVAPPLENRSTPDIREVTTWLARFVRVQNPTAIISDRWAIPLVPIALGLFGTGWSDEVATQLRNALIWLAQRYGRGSGLAGPLASPLEEVRHVIGNVVPPRDVQTRTESYLASLLLRFFVARFSRTCCD